MATIVTIGKSEANEESIFFTCFGYRTIEESIMLSSAFRPGFMYAAGEAKRNNDGKQSVQIQGYIAMSPEYVELDYEKLETRYVSIRQTLSKF